MIIFTIINAKILKAIVISGNTIYNSIGNGVGAMNDILKCPIAQTITVTTPTNSINNKLLMIPIILFFTKISKRIDTTKFIFIFLFIHKKSLTNVKLSYII